MEELKLIIEAVQGVSGDAKGLIIMYLIRGYVQMFLVFGGVVFAITRIYSLIQKAMNHEYFGGKVFQAAKFTNQGHHYDHKKKEAILEFLGENEITIK